MRLFEFSKSPLHLASTLKFAIVVFLDVGIFEAKTSKTKFAYFEIFPYIWELVIRYRFINMANYTVHSGVITHFRPG